MSTQSLGRRERKKAETRTRIQRAALDLFEEHGFTETSIEQITELADVSTTTFFRYFRTKDETVAHNAFTPVFLRALNAQSGDLPPLEAIRTALRTAGASITPETWNHERRRQLYVLGEPGLRGPSVGAIRNLFDELAALVAARAERESSDPDVTAFTGAVLGIFGSAVVNDDLTVDDYLSTLDRALDFLAEGMPLTNDS